MAHVPDAAVDDFFQVSLASQSVFTYYCRRRNRGDCYGWTWPGDTKVAGTINIHPTYVPRARAALIAANWVLPCPVNKRCVLVVKGFEQELLERSLIKLDDNPNPRYILASDCPRHRVENLRLSLRKSKTESKNSDEESKTESKISNCESKTESCESKTESCESKTQSYPMEPLEEPVENHTVSGSSSLSPHVDPPDPKFWRGQEPDELHEEFERICRMPNRKAQSTDQREAIFQAWKRAVKGEYTVADIARVGRYWYTVRLAGRDQVPPTPAQVVDNIEAARIWEASLGSQTKEKTDDGSWREHYRRAFGKVLRDLAPEDKRRAKVQEALTQLQALPDRESLNRLLLQLDEAGVTIT